MPLWKQKTNLSTTNRFKFENGKFDDSDIAVVDPR